jgi:hypothetical protein
MENKTSTDVPLSIIAHEASSASSPSVRLAFRLQSAVLNQRVRRLP